MDHLTNEKLSDDQLEQMCTEIVDSWEMDTLIEYALTNLYAHYHDNPVEAIEQWKELEIEDA